MSEADKANFAKLSPESQKWVSDRIQGQQADYTRKTQAVAEAKAKVDQLAQAQLQKLQQYDAILSKFANPDIAPPDPALQMTDLPRFQAEMAHYVQAKHLQDLAQKEQAKNKQEIDALNRQNVQRFYQEETGKLLSHPEAGPVFSDPVKGKAAKEAAFGYATKAGYSQNELKMVSAKDLITLWKAAQFDAASKVKAAAVPVQAKAPVTAKPGPAKAATRGGMTAAVQALSSNPSREALAQAFLAEMNSER